MDRAAISQAPFESPIGRMWVAISPRGLVSVTRGEDPDSGDDGWTLDPEGVAPAVEELQAYFAGRLQTFSIPLDLRGARAFDSAVWKAALQIPYAKTVSYGELGAMAGFPRAARAVGGSMSRCPFFPVVPCHRVIHADGSIGGWGSDTWIKRWLLDLERRGSIG